METRKFLLFSLGIVVIVALLVTTNIYATNNDPEIDNGNYNTCTSRTISHSPGNVIVNVAQSTLNGQRTYKYTMTNAPGKTLNPNKFFVYVRDGLENDLSATVCGTNCSSSTVTYLNHPATLTGGFPVEVWRVNGHEDGVGVTNVAIGKEIRLSVPERFKPDVTTVVLGIGSSLEHCGPIYGPTGPEASEGFEGSPLVTTVSRKTFENGCVYNVVAGERDNIVVSMTAVTPFGTNPPEACEVTIAPTYCTDPVNIVGGVNVGGLGLVFCPPGELGRPPFQSLPGGTCFYPPNLKFKC